MSKSNIPAVVRYIQSQEQHHKKMMFKEEFIALLKKHGVEYDPRYVFGRLCRAYGALVFLSAYPALTRWANLATRLRR